MTSADKTVRVTVVPKPDDGFVVECSACGVLNNPQASHVTTRFASDRNAEAVAAYHRTVHYR